MNEAGASERNVRKLLRHRARLMSRTSKIFPLLSFFQSFHFVVVVAATFGVRAEISSGPQQALN